MAGHELTKNNFFHYPYFSTGLQLDMQVFQPHCARKPLNVLHAWKVRKHSVYGCNTLINFQKLIKINLFISSNFCSQSEEQEQQNSTSGCSYLLLITLILFFSAPLRKISTVFSTSKIHLAELLPVMLSLEVLAHLIFSRICIGSQLINALNSNLPH